MTVEPETVGATFQGTTPQSVNGHLSIVMPAHNEAGVIEQVVRELDRDVASRFDRAELLVVDDRSTDETPAILARLAAELPRLRVITNAENLGHGRSLLRALDMAAGEWIFELDSDRQHLASEFWDLWAARQDADLVLGVRVIRRDEAYRRVLSHAVRLGVSAIALHSLRDSNVPFRLFRREYWNDVRPFIADETLAVPIHAAVAGAVRGWRIAQVPVTHLPRTSGMSFHRGGRVLKFSVRGLGQLVAFRASLVRARRRQGG